MDEPTPAPLLEESVTKSSEAKEWTNTIVIGFVSGYIFACFFGKLLDLSGLVQIWNRDDRLTFPGMFVMWLLMAAGMGIAARYKATAEFDPDP